MTPPEIVTFIDRAVAELDAEMSGVSLRQRTSSWTTIVRVWREFKAHVEALDRAVADPLTAQSIRTLGSGQCLVGDEAYRLSFWFPHIATALARQRR